MNMKKEKEKNVKKDIKNDKSVLVAKIISAISLIISCLALLLGCCANVSKNNDKNIEVRENLPKIADTTNDYFIYNEDYGYKLKDDLTSTQYTSYFVELTEHLNDSIDNYITFIYTDNSSTSIYSVIKLNYITATNYGIKCFTYENDNLVYFNIDGSIQDLQEGRVSLIFRFNKPILYTERLAYYYKSIVILYNIDSAYNFYYQNLTYGLLGAFKLDKTFIDMVYNFKGELNYFNADLDYNTFTFDSINISYERGMVFYSTNDLATIYRISNEVNNEKRYSLFFLNDNSDNFVKITNLVFGVNMFNRMSYYFVDTHVHYMYDYSLKDLYYNQNTEGIVDYDRVFDFIFKSNNKTFTRYEDIYAFDTTTDDWRRKVYYSYQNVNELVLDYKGYHTIKDNQVSDAKYIFYTRLDYYQTFTIYDYFNADIQRFQLHYNFKLITINDDLIHDEGALTDALDLIVLVFTSFLPFLSFELFPSITIGVLLLVPFFITLMMFIFNMFKR